MTASKELLRANSELAKNQIDFESFKLWKTELAKSPPKSKVKTMNKVDYLPIEAIKARLDHFLGGAYTIEVIESKQIMNSVCVTARIHYFHPFFKQWMFVDGCGAAPIHTRKGAEAMDAINVIASSVQKAFPAAKSFAVKNAAKELGPAFGSNLNKDFESQFLVNSHVEESYNPIAKIMEDEQD